MMILDMKSITIPERLPPRLNYPTIHVSGSLGSGKLFAYEAADR